MNHPCPLCGAAFKQIAKLKSHIILHEDKKTYRCEFCDKLFSKSSNLYSHMRTHTGEKPFQCAVCDKFFPRMNTLRAHIVKLHKVNKDAADQLILTPQKLKSKQENGTRKQPEVIQSNRVSPNDDKQVNQDTVVKETEFYTVHADMVTYSEDVDESTGSQTKRVYYKCKTCSKEMSHKSNMEDHARSHSGIKLFKCKLCGKGLSRKQNLVHHLKHVHYIENTHIDQNIERVNDPKTVKEEIDEPKTGKKMKRNVFKAPILLDSNSKLNENSKESSDNETDDSLLYKKDHVKEGKYIKIEPGEDKPLECKTDNFDVQREIKIESNDISSRDVNELDTLPVTGESACVKSPYFKSEMDFTTNGYNKREMLKDNGGSTSKPDKDALDLFSKLDEFCMKISNQLESKFEKRCVASEVKPKPSKPSHEEKDTSDSLITEDTYPMDYSQESDQMYVVLNPDNPSLRMYKCSICDFECKRRYYMAEEHILKHTSYKPYLCVVCCKPYRRKYTLRCHLSKEHKINGAELDEIMVATGSKVDASLSSSYTTKLNASSCSDVEAELLDNSKLELNDSADREKNNSINSGEDFGALYSENVKDRSTDENVNDSDDSSLRGESKRPNSMHSEENQMARIDSTLDTSNGESPPRTRKRKMTPTKDKPDHGSKSANLMESTISDPDSIPSFLTSVYNMINCRQPKRKCQFNEEMSEMMDLKNMVCLKCNKKCSNKSNLKQHVRFVHLNLKDFACLVCGKKFNTKFNLKVHWKQHSDLCDANLKEEFACKKCGKIFTTRSYLKVHMVNKHSVNKNRIESNQYPSGNTFTNENMTDCVNTCVYVNDTGLNMNDASINPNDTNIDVNDAGMYLNDTNINANDISMDLTDAKTNVDTKMDLNDTNINIGASMDLNDTNINVDSTNIDLSDTNINANDTNIDLNNSNISVNHMSMDANDTNLNLNDNSINLTDTSVNMNHDVENSTMNTDCSENISINTDCAIDYSINSDLVENTRTKKDSREDTGITADCEDNSIITTDCIDDPNIITDSKEDPA